MSAAAGLSRQKTASRCCLTYLAVIVRAPAQRPPRYDYSGLRCKASPGKSPVRAAAGEHRGGNSLVTLDEASPLWPSRAAGVPASRLREDGHFSLPGIVEVLPAATTAVQKWTRNDLASARWPSSMTAQPCLHWQPDWMCWKALSLLGKPFIYSLNRKYPSMCFPSLIYDLLFCLFLRRCEKAGRALSQAGQ